jgi:polar amino acid transport system substrate-binding protein
MKKIAVLVLLIGTFFMATNVGAQTLTVLAEENPPFNTVKDGSAQGAATDLFLAIAAKAGLKVTRDDVKTQPWVRSYEAVQTQVNTVLFPMARTAARENLFKWVGPIYKVQIGLIAPKARKLVIKDAADASKYKIGTVKDGAPEQAIVAAGVSVDLLDRSADLVGNLRKLQSGRIDMLAFNAVAANFNMASLGMNPVDYEVVFVLSEPQLYFALQKDTAPTTINALQTALDAAKKDGSYDAIIKKFIK